MTWKQIEPRPPASVEDRPSWIQWGQSQPDGIEVLAVVESLDLEWNKRRGLLVLIVEDGVRRQTSLGHAMLRDLVVRAELREGSRVRIVSNGLRALPGGRKGRHFELWVR